MKIVAIIFALLALTEVIGFFLGKGTHCAWAALVLAAISLFLAVYKEHDIKSTQR